MRGPDRRRRRHAIGHLRRIRLTPTPTQSVELVRDPDDDRLIEAAQAGRADTIVTGDQDLLTLERVDQIEIMTPRAFLDALQPDV